MTSIATIVEKVKTGQIQVYFGGRTSKTPLIVCFMRKEESERWLLGFGLSQRVEGGWRMWSKSTEGLVVKVSATRNLFWKH